MRNIHSVCNRDGFCMSSALTRNRCKKKTRMTLSPKTKRPFRTNKTKVTFQIIKLIKRVKKGRKSNRNEKGPTANEFEINLNKYKQNYHRLVCVFYYLFYCLKLMINSKISFAFFALMEFTGLQFSSSECFR